MRSPLSTLTKQTMGECGDALPRNIARSHWWCAAFSTDAGKRRRRTAARASLVLLLHDTRVACPPTDAEATEGSFGLSAALGPIDGVLRL